MNQPSDLFEEFMDDFSLACKKAGRAPADIEILPVSKGQSIKKIRSFLELADFPMQLAENYLEELTLKEIELSQVKWHYQGALQSRKINEIVRHASVIQSVSRVKELELIFRSSKEIKFYLQANISSEGQKLGADKDELKELLDFVAKSGQEKTFLGFMGVAAELSIEVSDEDVRGQFAELRAIRDELAPKAKLSMGMSGDYHLALMEGADMIRIGSLIFGKRVYT